jgi:hypothetical protein
VWDREAGNNMRRRDLYFSPNDRSIRLIKYRNMSWEGTLLVLVRREVRADFGVESLDLREATNGKTLA